MKSDYRNYIREMAEPIEVKYKGKLKPCPFCGSIPRVVKYLQDDILRFSDKFAVQCEYTNGCGAESQLNRIMATAIRVWNKRKSL